MANTRQQYIDLIAPIAQKTTRGTGLFASTMIGQAIVESNNGNSKLASKYNNHFGIKASKSWKGKSVNMATGEYTPEGQYYMDSGELFRVYDTIEEGFKDRNKFLKENPRYTKAGVFTSNTAEQQAEAFQEAGYATAPNYAEVIIGVINGSGKLKQYDIPTDPNEKQVISEGLNVRNMAGTENSIIWEVLEKGDKVKVLKTEGDWSEVLVEKSGCKGWINNSFIR